MVLGWLCWRLIELRQHATDLVQSTLTQETPRRDHRERDLKSRIVDHVRNEFANAAE